MDITEADIIRMKDSLSPEGPADPPILPLLHSSAICRYAAAKSPGSL
jgi:hypothetical protein